MRTKDAGKSELDAGTAAIVDALHTLNVKNSAIVDALHALHGKSSEIYTKNFNNQMKMVR